MVVVTVEVGFLVYNIASQCRPQKSTLKVVGCQCISRQQSLTVALCNQLLHYPSCLHIEAACRPQNPDDISVVLFFIFKKLHKVLVVLCKWCLPASAPAESKSVLCIIFLFLEPAVVVNINALAGILCSAYNNLIVFLYVSELHNFNLFAVPYGYSIHPAVFCQMPFSIYLEILRKNWCGMKALRCRLCARCRHKYSVRRLYKSFLSKIRFLIFRHFKTHYSITSLLFWPCYCNTTQTRTKHRI